MRFEKKRVVFNQLVQSYIIGRCNSYLLPEDIKYSKLGQLYFMPKWPKKDTKTKWEQCP